MRFICIFIVDILICILLWMYFKVFYLLLIVVFLFIVNVFYVYFYCKGILLRVYFCTLF
jgi:hypothetical protein